MAKDHKSTTPNSSVVLHGFTYNKSPDYKQVLVWKLTIDLVF